MKKLFIAAYILIALYVAATQMQSDSMGGLLGVDYLSTLGYLLKGLLWPIDVLRGVWS